MSLLSASFILSAQSAQFWARLFLSLVLAGEPGELHNLCKSDSKLHFALSCRIEKSRAKSLCGHVEFMVCVYLPVDKKCTKEEYPKRAPKGNSVKDKTALCTQGSANTTLRRSCAVRRVGLFSVGLFNSWYRRKAAGCWATNFLGQEKSKISSTVVVMASCFVCTPEGFPELFRYPAFGSASPFCQAQGASRIYQL